MKTLDITSKGITVSHILSTLGIIGGLIVWIISYAEDLKTVETRQEAIQSSQEAEARRNREWRDDVKTRQGEFHRSLESIHKSQMEILKELKHR